MIFGIAVVFPVVITFGRRRAWQGEQLQALTSAGRFCTGCSHPAALSQLHRPQQL